MQQSFNTLYADTSSFTQRPPLQGEVQVDVCIVGGGYTGLSAALHLCQQGKSVALLEAGQIGQGASGRNGGHVGVGQRVDQMTLESRLGQEYASSLWQLGLEAVELVEELTTAHNIDCGLKRNIIHLAHKEHFVEDYREEAEFLKQRYGYSECEFIEQQRLHEHVGSKQFYAGLIDYRSRHLDPYAYATGLAQVADGAGALLFEQSKASGYWQNSDGVTIATDKGQVSAKQLVIACNGYLDKFAPSMAGYIMPINNFIVATEPLSEQLAHSILPADSAAQDSRFVINYWRLSADNRLVFGGGENYRRGFPKDIIKFVQPHVHDIYPQLSKVKFDYGWGGTLAITLRRMPDFGQLADNVWYAQGYSGHGVPTATLGGKLLAEALNGQRQRWDLFANLPRQKFPGGTLLRWPGMVAGMAYYALRDRL